MTRDAEPSPQASDRSGGLRCPRCGCRHLPVFCTRHRGGRTVRVRECRHCGRRLVTYEQIQREAPPRNSAHGAAADRSAP